MLNLNKLYISFLIAMFLLCSLMNASEAYSATINAASCNYIDVSAAVNVASDGDIVQIPNGSCTWNNVTLNITKAITLKGNGLYAVSSTGNPRTDLGTWPLTITLTGYPTGCCNNSVINVNVSTGLLVRISGIHFTATGAGSPGDHTNFSGVILIRESNNTDWRVDNCRFAVQNETASVSTLRSDKGLIDHNYFYETRCGTDNIIWIGDRRLNVSGSGGTDYYANWSTSLPLAWGSSKFVFVEDNTFIDTGCTQSAATANLDLAYSGRAVVRYNYFYNGNFTWHGLGSGGAGRSGQAFEVYNNIIYWGGANRIQSFFGHRGCTALVHNNTFSNNMYITQLRLERRESTQGTWGFCDGTHPLWDGDWVNKSNSSCIGEGNPYGCCIGSGTGVCGGNYPVGYPCLDQPGWTVSSPSQSLAKYPNNKADPMAVITSGNLRLPQYPTRIWNNTRVNTGAVLNSAGESYVQNGRDYYFCDDSSCAQPNYTPFQYPHPLQSGSGVIMGIRPNPPILTNIN